MEKITNQHGDLLFSKVKEIPKGARELKIKKGFILEKGEGVHTHVLEDVEGIKVYEHEGNTYIRVGKQARINHEEHGCQVVQPGIYKKRIERVWDYEKEESRKVLD